MLDIRWIRENPELLDKALKNRGAEPASEQIIKLDEDRRMHIATLQEAQTRRNAASKAIGQAMAQKDTDKAEALKAEVAEIKSVIQAGEEAERELTAKLNDALSRLPNIPLEDVPVGADEDDNVEIRKVGEKPAFSFKPKEHYELGEALGGMDFETAAKMSGSRFAVLKGGIARLERALGQFMLDMHTSAHGYIEVQPPLLVRDEAMKGTGQLPKFKDDLFLAGDITGRSQLGREAIEKNLSEDDIARLRESPEDLISVLDALYDRADTREQYWLIPTAEVSLTNLVRDEVLDISSLPRRYTALTACFRSEAGSAGRDTRGYLRQHQFYKVELVSITAPDKSIEEHERMTKCAETILEKLGLHFRTVVLCTGDMGFGARKTYDIEVWLPGQEAYREISSCSVCGDFQARRMNARFRPEGEKETKFVHTLNGSGVAVGRALIAVMENYQNEDGSIRVPDVLKAYMGGVEVIAA